VRREFALGATMDLLRAYTCSRKEQWRFRKARACSALIDVCCRHFLCPSVVQWTRANRAERIGIRGRSSLVRRTIQLLMRSMKVLILCLPCVECNASCHGD